MTLLVLTLTVPQVEDAIGGAYLRAALSAEWPKFAIYLVSFLIVGQAWLGHHFIFSHFRRADHRLVWLNMFLLITVAIIPFSTALLGQYAGHPHDRVIAALVYGGIWSFFGWFLTSTFWYASGKADLLNDTIDRKRLSALRATSLVGPMIYSLFTLLALVNFWVSVCGFAVVPLFYIYLGIRSPDSTVDGQPA